jgi:hypothetical protein
VTARFGLSRERENRETDSPVEGFGAAPFTSVSADISISVLLFAELLDALVHR